MTKILTLVLAGAIGRVAAIPYGPTTQFIERRQAASSPLSHFLSHLQNQTLGWYLGEEEATAAATSFAALMGASRTAPGLIGDSTRSVLNAGFGTVKAPSGAVPARVVMKSRTNTTGAETIKLRYGPYKVPSMNKKNQLGEMGMLSNWPDKNLPKPCEGDCTIIGMTPGLEYLDGRNANIDSGMWLHHMVLFNVGPGRSDPTCADRDISVPHATVGTTPRNSERIFASGNERSNAIFPEWGMTDVGYKLKAADKFAALVELMNQTPEDQTVYLTMTYDVVKGHPFKDDVKVVWFDIRQCGTSEYNPPKNPTFEINYPWTANLDGEVFGSIGHLHDGGDNIKMTVDGKETCQNNAQYGTKPDFIQKTDAGAHGHGATNHISEMNVCSGKSLLVKNMAKGQKWNLRAWYDMNKNKGMQHESALDAVMGISITFVRTKGV